MSLWPVTMATSHGFACASAHSTITCAVGCIFVAASRQSAAAKGPSYSTVEDPLRQSDSAARATSRWGQGTEGVGATCQ